ncbi:hypothetical protein HYPSUDRAFT_202819 [Hypholoma sublateritium FD-334 SS-4]|uniref:Uncharacterized protein n=1 Tax=Hypholoma sublateritium (strain FD-334 SS-4) TaxID=945553 RepID=A0A0D2PPA7_HYPSF|nr:hypothetical protein HYPSUDRAFT_202819 [Hypholoma sublateritium FD-334 SS-4]
MRGSFKQVNGDCHRTVDTVTAHELEDSRGNILEFDRLILGYSPISNVVPAPQPGIVALGRLLRPTPSSHPRTPPSSCVAALLIDQALRIRAALAALLHRHLSTKKSVLIAPPPRSLSPPCRGRHAVDADFPVSPAHDDAASVFAVFVDGSGASHHPPLPSNLIGAISNANAICAATTTADVVSDPNSALCSCARPTGLPRGDGNDESASARAPRSPGRLILPIHPSTRLADPSPMHRRRRSSVRPHRQRSRALYREPAVSVVAQPIPRASSAYTRTCIQCMCMSGRSLSPAAGSSQGPAAQRSPRRFRDSTTPVRRG